MIMRKGFLITILVMCFASGSKASQVEEAFKLYLKSPGNTATTHVLNLGNDGGLTANKGSLPVKINRNTTEKGSKKRIEITITALEKVYFNFENKLTINDYEHEECLFYMPGFWYRKNLRSPKEAPSWYTSDSWQVREDRLSTPLTGIYDEKLKTFYTVARFDTFNLESQPCHDHGEVILSDKTSIGFTGFSNNKGKASLVYGFPYSEAPKTYIRKLTLIEPVRTFEKLEKGESKKLVWELNTGEATDFSDFVAKVWNYSYDSYKPQKMENVRSVDAAKHYLSNFFVESYVDKYNLKYYSGVHLKTEDCAPTGSVEVGFVGRVLLNAFNALEYGEQHNNQKITNDAYAIFESYLKHGFTPAGFFREFVDYNNNSETATLSIRRQSEGVFAVLNFLDYEKRRGREHKEWETRVKSILDNFLKLQNTDGSFPRKFDDSFNIEDKTGGSTPSATLPLTMAYKYFNQKTYLNSARRTATYLEKELISKADYFSSTLDANCEDKEASLYASTAMYYLSMTTKGKERKHYIDLCKQAAYFSLSWYYMWDVPFAPGQMLGDVGFKSRGWGNVSVENNHVDVFIFEFATVLDWLSKECKESRFVEFAHVIRSSMLQLMPVEGSMYNIGKVGFYPEVVQHTNWDYGKNGKGFYNDIFAPGWTVASLWQMLSPNRVSNFFK